MKLQPVTGNINSVLASSMSRWDASNPNDLAVLIAELVDNSIDARADHIKLTFDSKTFSFIISDNGDGFSPESVKQCFGEIGDRVNEISRVGRWNLGHKYLYYVAKPIRETFSSIREGQNIEGKLENCEYGYEICPKSNVEDDFKTTIRYEFMPTPFSKYFSKYNIDKIKEYLAVQYGCTNISLFIDGKPLDFKWNLFDVKNDEYYLKSLVNENIIFDGKIIGTYSAGFLKNPLKFNNISGRVGYISEGRIVEPHNAFSKYDLLTKLTSKENRYLGLVGIHKDFLHSEDIKVDSSKTVFNLNYKIVQEIKRIEDKARKIYNNLIAEEEKQQKNEQESQIFDSLNEKLKNFRFTGNFKKIRGKEGEKTMIKKERSEICKKSPRGSSVINVLDFGKKSENIDFKLQEGIINVNRRGSLYEDILNGKHSVSLFSRILLSRLPQYINDESINNFFNDSELEGFNGKLKNVLK